MSNRKNEILLKEESNLIVARKKYQSEEREKIERKIKQEKYKLKMAYEMFVLFNLRIL